jgi:RNA polymerase sigma factor (sigma-70 family)
MKAIDIRFNVVHQKKGILQRLLLEANRYKPLTFEEERTATREQLINHNMMFAITVAFRHYVTSVDIMDIISESMIGLIKAADKFDRNSEYKFISFAVYQMRSEIQNFINSKRDIIRYPDKAHIVKHQIRNMQDEPIETIAKQMNVSEHYVKMAKEMIQYVSLDHTDDEGNEIYTPASDSQTDSRALQSDSTKVFKYLVKCLNTKEYKVIEHRYLKDYAKDYKQIGEMINVTGERARQLEKQAFDKIKNQYARIKMDS